MAESFFQEGPATCFDLRPKEAYRFTNFALAEAAENHLELESCLLVENYTHLFLLDTFAIFGVTSSPTKVGVSSSNRLPDFSFLTPASVSMSLPEPCLASRFKALIVSF